MRSSHVANEWVTFQQTGEKRFYCQWEKCSFCKSHGKVHTRTILSSIKTRTQKTTTGKINYRCHCCLPNIHKNSTKIVWLIAVCQCECYLFSLFLSLLFAYIIANTLLSSCYSTRAGLNNASMLIINNCSLSVCMCECMCVFGQLLPDLFFRLPNLLIVKTDVK